MVKGRGNKEKENDEMRQKRLEVASQLNKKGI